MLLPKCGRIISVSSVAGLNGTRSGKFSCLCCREVHQRVRARRGRRPVSELATADARAAAGHCTSLHVICPGITYRTKKKGMVKAKITVLPKKASDTVMVVDDQSTSRAILEQVVRNLDGRVQVSAFARPVDALVWATRHIADLVLVDYLMPDMNGIEFVKRLRGLPGYENVPILMVTAHDARDARDARYAALDAGITDLLSKPVDVRECMARCRNLLTLRRQQFALEDRQRVLEIGRAHV